MRIKAHRRGSNGQQAVKGVHPSSNASFTKSQEELDAHFKDAYKSLRHYAYKMVGSTEAAEDVVQEAYANTVTAIQRGSNIENLGGWLSRCVRNSSLQYIEQQSRRSHPLLEDFDLDDGGPGPEGTVINRRYMHSLYKALKQLTPQQRYVFLTTEVQGLKQREVAKELGCTENAVAQLLLRARDHIRKSIGPRSLGVVPIFWLLCRVQRIKESCKGSINSVSVKAAHAQSSVSGFTRALCRGGRSTRACDGCACGGRRCAWLGQPGEEGKLSSWKQVADPVPVSPRRTRLQIDRLRLARRRQPSKTQEARACIHRHRVPPLGMLPGQLLLSTEKQKLQRRESDFSPSGSNDSTQATPASRPSSEDTSQAIGTGTDQPPSGNEIHGPPSYTFMGTVSVGSNPVSIEVTPDGSHAYVTNIGSDSVSVINTLTQETEGAPIGVGSDPWDIAITPNGEKAYVANAHSNTVSVIDENAENTAPIAVGSGPFGVAVTPDGSRVYVANAYSDSVSVIGTRLVKNSKGAE